MRINRIEFDEDSTSKVGLKKIKLDRLGSVIALVGKNGSGKSRVLNFIENNFTPTIIDFLDLNIVLPPNSIQDSLAELQRYRAYIHKKDELTHANILRQKNRDSSELAGNYRKLKDELAVIVRGLSLDHQQVGPNTIRSNQITVAAKIQKILDNVNPQIVRIKNDYIKRVDYSQIRQLKEAITENDDVANSFEKLVESVTENLDYDEFGSIYTSSLRFLRKLPHQLAFDWIDCLGDAKKFEKRVANKRYKALKEIFDNIFGKKLEWETKNVSKNVTESGVQSTHAGVWKIDGREFNYSEFSEGEKTLFSFVLLFFLMSQNKNIRLKESVIIIDEPELHLHPDAEIDLINGIRNIIQDTGQLWIATHSINILSHLNIDEVFMVKDGQISHPTKTIQREALSELMTIEERVLKLSEFITSISDWSFVHFMIECFTNPEVIEVAKENDPQINSLREFINVTDGQKRKMLLDFGAGKGRLYEQASQDEKFNEIIDYYALEPSLDFHSSLVSKGVKNIYASYDDLINEKFDFVVLCNVLHEISIEEWIPTLNKVIDLLKPTGSVIIIEARTLVKGEKIGDIGYLLLSEEEIQVLFGLEQKPISLKHKEEYQNITSVIIPKPNLNTLSNEHLLKALEVLQKNSISKIRNLRNNSESEKNSNKYGRQAAFLSQQYINAKLAFDSIVIDKRKK